MYFPPCIFVKNMADLRRFWSIRKEYAEVQKDEYFRYLERQ